MAITASAQAILRPTSIPVKKVGSDSETSELMAATDHQVRWLLCGTGVRGYSSCMVGVEDPRSKMDKSVKEGRVLPSAPP